VTAGTTPFWLTPTEVLMHLGGNSDISTEVVNHLIQTAEQFFESQTGLILTPKSYIVEMAYQKNDLYRLPHRPMNNLVVTQDNRPLMHHITPEGVVCEMAQADKPLRFSYQAGRVRGLQDSALVFTLLQMVKHLYGNRFHADNQDILPLLHHYCDAYHDYIL